MRLSKRFFPIAFFLTVTGLVCFTFEQTHAKPYACGKETCEAHKTKKNCQVCKQAVCDKDAKGKEYLVPGTATTTKCTEPAKGPGKGAVPSQVTPGQLAPLQNAPNPDRGGVRPTVPAQPPAKQ